MSHEEPAGGGLVKDLVSVVTSPRRLKQLLAVPLYRNALYLMTGSAMTGIFGLVFWLIAANLHSAETVGLASATVSAMLLLSLLATLGLDYALIRFLPLSANGAAMINTSLTVGGLAALVISLVFIAGLSLWSPVLLFIQRNALLSVGFVTFTTVYAIYMIQTRSFVARRASELSLAQNLLFNASRVGLLFVMALWFGTFGIVSAWGIATVLALALGVILFQPRLEAGYRPVPTIARDVVSQLMRYSFTNYIAAMLWTAPGYILPLMVANLVGAESNAHFYVAWSMANVVFQLPLAISLSLLAEGSSDEHTLGLLVRRCLLFTFPAVAPVILLLTLLGKTLLAYFDPGYADAAGLLRILAISAVPMSINCIYFAVERVRMRMARVVAMNAFLAAATLGLSWALLPRMGLEGAGVAWMAGQGVSALGVVFVFLVWRKTKKRSGMDAISQGEEQA